MSDQEKTRFAPRNFGIAAKTVVMDLPPRMTMHLRVATPEEPRLAQPEPRLAQPEPRPAQSEPRLAQPEPRPAQLEPRLAQPEPRRSQPEPRPAQSGQGFPPALTHIVAPRPAFDPRATRMALSAVPTQAAAPPQPIEITTGEIVRGPQTRIARSSRPAEQHTALPSLPPSYLEPAKPPAMWPTATPVGTPRAMVVLRRRLQEKSTRLRVMIGAAALLVALVFLIPLSSSSANSSASASNNATDKAAQNAPDKTAHNATDKTAQNGTDKAAQNAPNKAAQNAPASEARDQETTPKLPAAARQQVTTPPVADPQRELNEAAPTQAAAPAPASANTEEMAAAMLLSGRREEALQMYQALAKSTAASPGIEAMVLVLSQKVAAQ